VRGRASTARSIALLAAASAAVHELRYLIGYGHEASRALAAHPHGYLSVALPGVMTAALIALAGVLMRLAGRRDTRSLAPTVRRSLPALWLCCTIALALIYGTQETLEGSGAIAGSGWIGLALAVPAGFLVALALRGADAAEALRVQGAALLAVSLGTYSSGLSTERGYAFAGVERIRARGPPLAFVM
jgi:hypothetical protein